MENLWKLGIYDLLLYTLTTTYTFKTHFITSNRETKHIKYVRDGCTAYIYYINNNNKLCITSYSICVCIECSRRPGYRITTSRPWLCRITTSRPWVCRITTSRPWVCRITTSRPWVCRITTYRPWVCLQTMP